MSRIPVSEKICILRMKGTFYNTCIICAYAPTDKSNLITKQQLDVQKDAFYDELEAKHGAKYAIGDFNAKIGKEKVYRDMIRIHSLHRPSSDNGCRLIYFAASRDLIIHHQHMFAGQENPLREFFAELLGYFASETSAASSGNLGPEELELEEIPRLTLAEIKAAIGKLKKTSSLDPIKYQGSS